MITTAMFALTVQSKGAAEVMEKTVLVYHPSGFLHLSLHGRPPSLSATSLTESGVPRYTEV